MVPVIAEVSLLPISTSTSACVDDVRTGDGNAIPGAGDDDDVGLCCSDDNDAGLGI